MSIERTEAARILRCTCPRTFKYHANNCPVQPGEHQEDWARKADARIEELEQVLDKAHPNHSLYGRAQGAAEGCEFCTAIATQETDPE